MEVIREMFDFGGGWELRQAGVAIYVDGERVVECWEQADPNLSEHEVLSRAHEAARCLRDRQIVGQQQLLDVGPFD